MKDFAIEIEPEYYKDGVINIPSEIIVSLNGEDVTNPTHIQLIEAGWVYYNPVIHNVSIVKTNKLNELVVFDKSKDVNSFFIGETQAWIDRDTRVSLMNSTQILKNAGHENTTLWLNGQSFTVPCDALIQMLGALEIYALQCYNVTEQHKANVNNLSNLENINEYDFKVGYPEKLVFNI